VSLPRSLTCVSILALTGVIVSNVANAQQTLPTIDVGGQRRSSARGHVTSRNVSARPGTSGQIQPSAGQSGGGSSAPTGLAAAQPLRENNTTYRPEDAVTATRTKTPIMDTPASIQVVPRAVLNDRQVTQISDAINVVSGVIAADAQQSNIESYWIRGFYTNSYYLDGVRMNGNYTNSYQNTANIDRIEVLKGPASILYGRGDPGGIVNLVTKQPLDHQTTTIQQQVGSWSSFRTTLDTTGPLTDDKSVLYRFNLAVENSNNFGQNTNNEHDIFLAPKIRWRPDEHTTLDAWMTFSNRTTPTFATALPFVSAGPNSFINNPIYSLAYGTGSEPASLLPRRLNQATPWSRSQSQDLIAGYSFARDLNEDWTFRHQFQTQFTGYKYPSQTPSNYNDSLVDPSMIGYVGLPLLQDNIGFGEPSNNTYYYYWNANLTGKVLTGPAEHTVLLGTDYTHFNQAGFTTFATSQPFGPVPPSSPTFPVYSPFPNYSLQPSAVCSDPNYDGTTACRSDFGFHEAWWGAFIQDQIKLPHDIFAMAAVRYDNATFYDDVLKRTTSQSQHVTPRFGLLWRPIDPVSFYGSYLTGFGPAPFTASANQALKPETSQQWEVGVKTELLDKRLTATVAYYDLTKQNIARPDPTDPTGQAQIVVGAARNRGAELDIAGEIIPGWRVIGGYSYIASIITKDSNCNPAAYNQFVSDFQNFLPAVLPGGCVVDSWSTYTNGNPTLLSLNGLKGHRLGGVPRNSGSLWTTYDVQEGDLKGLKFGGGLTSRSLMQGDDQNDFHVPGYAKFDLMASYERKIEGVNTTFQLNVYNLLDTRYYGVGYPSPYSLQTGTPRSLRGSIRVQF
jgi:iron complex outermembrane recepter protein